MSVTISADDPRTIRAIEIAAHADEWLKWRTDDGQAAYGIASQSQPGQYYLVTCSTCDCPDFRRNTLEADACELRPCKHVLAVRLYTELVRALHEPTPQSRRRGHLTLVRE